MAGEPAKVAILEPDRDEQAAANRRELIEAVRRNARRRLRRAVATAAGTGACLAVLLALELASRAGWLEAWHVKPLGFSEWVKAGLIVLVLLIYLRAVALGRRMVRLDKASEADLRRTLLDSPEALSGERTPEFTRLLCQSLQSVGPRDEERMRLRDLRALARTVEDADEDHDLRMAALAALRYVADERAASRIAAIANAPIMTRKEKALRRAARRYLPEIRTRLDSRRATGRLLRPAEAPAHDALLRPARGSAADDARVLVRAADDGVAPDRRGP